MFQQQSEARETRRQYERSCKVTYTHTHTHTHTHAHALPQQQAHTPTAGLYRYTNTHTHTHRPTQTHTHTHRHTHTHTELCGQTHLICLSETCHALIPCKDAFKFSNAQIQIYTMMRNVPLLFLSGISQRDYTQYYHHISKQEDSICHSIHDFFRDHIQY